MLIVSNWTPTPTNWSSYIKNSLPERPLELQERGDGRITLTHTGQRGGDANAMARKMKRSRTECEPARYALRKSLVQIGTLHLLCFKSRLACRGPSDDDMPVEDTTPPRRSFEVQRSSTKKNKTKVYTSHIMLKSSSQQAAHDFALLHFSKKKRSINVAVQFLIP